MIILPDHQQGSEAWFNVRRGRPTASRFGDIITPAKGEYSKSAIRYMHEIIASRFITDTDDASGFFGTRWTDRGTELEPEARAAFSAHTGLEVTQVGFCVREVNGQDGLAGCSPDGLIPDNEAMEYVAGLEIKCPLPKEHVATVAGGKLPDDHKPQVHGSMVITGLPRWHFWSYCPGLRPFHCIVERDDFTDKVEAALDRFTIEYAALRDQILPNLRLPKTTLTT